MARGIPRICGYKSIWLSRDILEKAMVLSGGKVKDDMTVLVSKIYSIY